MNESSFDIDEKISKRQAELKKALDARDVVSAAIYEKEKELLELKETKRKSNHVISGIRLELESLKAAFWRAKGENL